MAQNDQKKWRFFILLGSVGVILLSTIFKLFSLHTTKPKVVLPRTAFPTIIAPTPIHAPTGQVQMQRYVAASFTADYPHDWTFVQTPFSMGGETTGFRPQKLPSGSYVPSLYIDAEPATASAHLQNEQKLYLNTYHFTKTPSVIDGIPGVTLRGAYPKKQVNGSVINSPIQLSLTYVQKGATVYTIRYKYDGAIVDKTYEDLFSSLISFFRFGQ